VLPKVYVDDDDKLSLIAVTAGAATFSIVSAGGRTLKTSSHTLCGLNWSKLVRDVLNARLLFFCFFLIVAGSLLFLTSIDRDDLDFFFKLLTTFKSTEDKGTRSRYLGVVVVIILRCCC